MKTAKYIELATRVTARNNCIKHMNENGWIDRHADVIDNIIDSLPHGSGIDGKTEVDYDKSRRDRIVINSEYHKMNDGGFYDGWIQFRIVITPSLQFGAYVDVHGNFGKEQHIKEYLQEVFSNALFELY